MKQVDIDRDIATEAAIKIVCTLIDKYDIPAETVFNFIDSKEDYKKLLDDDDTLICMLHDDSIYEFIDLMREQIKQ